MIVAMLSLVILLSGAHVDHSTDGDGGDYVDDMVLLMAVTTTTVRLLCSIATADSSSMRSKTKNITLLPGRHKCS